MLGLMGMLFSKEYRIRKTHSGNEYTCKVGWLGFEICGSDNPKVWEELGVD